MEQHVLTEENLQEVTGGDVSNSGAAGIGVSSALAGAGLAATALAFRKPVVHVNPTVHVNPGEMHVHHAGGVPVVHPIQEAVERGASSAVPSRAASVSSVLSGR
jgi:hypothetical protein